MQQSYDMAEKVRAYIDGDEIPGLVNFGELTIEINQIEVPEFEITRLIDSGVKKIPAQELTYKLARESKTLKFLQSWFFNKETHDLTKVRVDASGVEFARTLFPGCRCVSYNEPQYDAASPTYAQCKIKLVPWDIFPVQS